MLKLPFFHQIEHLFLVLVLFYVFQSLFDTLAFIIYSVLDRMPGSSHCPN